MTLLLAFPNLAHSAACHSDEVLLRQVIAGRCLLGKMYWRERLDTDESAWVGHADAAAVYLTLCLREMELRGLETHSHVAPFTVERTLDARWMGLELVHTMDRAIPPPWLGDSDTHVRHRIRLRELDLDHYAHIDSWRTTSCRS